MLAVEEEVWMEEGVICVYIRKDELLKKSHITKMNKVIIVLPISLVRYLLAYTNILKAC